MSTAFRNCAAAAGLLACALGGCGGGGGGDNRALPLTQRLPAGASGYAAADLSALREDLGLDAEADPLRPAPGNALRTAAAEAMAGVRSPAGAAPEDVVGALDLGLATAIAASRDDAAPVTAIATAADTGEIGSALGDMGFGDRGGLLLRGAGDPAILLEEGIVLASPDPAALRELPEEAAGEPPDPLLDDLDAPFVETSMPRGGGCVRSVAASGEADGSGEVAFLIGGGADASRVRASADARVELGEPEADGDVATADVAAGDAGGFAALTALRSRAVTYEC